MPVNAIVLAGRATADALGEFTRASNKALVDINGKPMISYVIAALLDAPRVGQIVVVGPREGLAPVVETERVRVVEDAGSIVDNIRIGARQLPADEKILIATSDIPMVTGSIIEGFIDLCLDRPADLYYPIVEKGVNEQKYPLVKRTYVALQEGIYTGGNLFLIAPWIVEPVAPKVKVFIENRKNPIQLSRLLGLTFLVKLLLKLLTIPELEKKMSQLWGVQAVAVNCPMPEIGIDVDKPNDLQLVRAALK